MFYMIDDQVALIVPAFELGQAAVTLLYRDFSGELGPQLAFVEAVFFFDGLSIRLFSLVPVWVGSISTGVINVRHLAIDALRGGTCKRVGPVLAMSTGP